MISLTVLFNTLQKISNSKRNGALFTRATGCAVYSATVYACNSPCLFLAFLIVSVNNTVSIKPDIATAALIKNAPL